MGEMAGNVEAEPARRRERSGGRTARREMRSHGAQGVGRPFILRGIPTYDVMKSAARTEPDVARLLVDMQAYRFSNIATIPKRLDALGALRSELSIDDAARTIWALASPEVRQMLLTFAGWSVKRYRTWLEGTLVAVLLPPPSSTRSKRKASRDRVHQE